MLIAGALTLTSAGCFHSSAKSIDDSSIRQQQLQAYIQQQTAMRAASLPEDQHCDELAAAMPGVEEIRSDQKNVESRQWTLLANGSDRKWVFVRAADSSAQGWAPKPGLDKLDFEPPLEPALATRSSVFLVYAPADIADPADSQRFVAMRDAFGVAQGTFTWRGRKYAYTLAPELPCFPRLQ
jgi:hypothetical protein